MYSMFQMNQKRYNFTISSTVGTSRIKVECAIVNAGRQHTYNTCIYIHNYTYVTVLFIIIYIQWNLRIMKLLGQPNVFIIKRFSLKRGFNITYHETTKLLMVTVSGLVN